MRLRQALFHSLTAIALVPMVVLAGCSSSTAPLPLPLPEPNALRIPIYGAPTTTDPARSVTPPSILLASLLFSSLVKVGPDLHVIPDLAVSIPTISDDGRTYTFTVRQDARFADGRHCTAADVAYSLARALSPEVNSRLAHRYLGEIEGAGAVERGETAALSGVQVTDRMTVRIRLVHADASFLDKLALPVASVVDRRVLGPKARGPWFWSPAGTGPWVLAAMLPGGSLDLKPRRHYYGGSLQLHDLLLIPVPNAARAIELYRKRQLDLVQVPAEQFGSMSARGDFHDSASLDAYYALPVSGAEGAVLTAQLDRQRLIRQSGPALSPLDAIVPPAVPDYVSSAPTVDLSSTKVEPRVRVETDSRSDSIEPMLQRALYRQWAPAHRGGMLVRLVHVRSPLPDPAVWLQVVLPETHSSWYPSLLLHASRLTNDPVTRMSAYSRGENWALEKALVIPLASGNIGFLIKARVQSLQVTPLGIMPDNNNWSSVSVT